MTPDEIKSKIARNHIGAITLDTSAFGKPSEMSLEHGLLPRLEQFRGSSVRFILSDIVSNEILAHMKKGAAESLSQLDKSMKKLGNAWNVSAEKRAEARKSLIGVETPELSSQRRLNSFFQRTGCTVIKAEEHAIIGNLVRRYFSHIAPFADKDTKKNEFPDALALLSLETWALNVDTKILVVSNDEDWIRYCIESERLILVRGLADALSYFHANASVVCNLLSQMLMSGMRSDWNSAIEEAVESHIEGMDFIPEADSTFYFEGEITELYISNLSIGEEDDVLRPVDFGENYLVAETQVVVDVDITFDFSFSIKDGIDKDYVPIGSASCSRTETLELMILITFAGNIPDAAEINEIEVQGNLHYVRFGFIEPDWMNNPSYYEK